MYVTRVLAATATVFLVGTLTVPATAHAAPAAAKKSPNVAINGNKTADFSPTSETVEQGTGTTCTNKDYSVSIQNKTKVPQQLQISGNDFGGPIAPKAKTFICQGVGTLNYGLASNPDAVFTLTVTPHSG